MKLATIIAALVAIVASLAAGGNAFVMPSVVPAGLGRTAGQALAPAISPPAPSRSAGSAVGALKVKIVLGEEENMEAALLRFRRTVSRSGHLQELRWKRNFETVAETKKRKRALNLRKDKIQRSRERKANEHRF